MQSGVISSAATRSVADAHADEVARGQRFEFGRNWSRFLAVLDDDRIAAATRRLQAMLDCGRLDGARFLDIGSGSGLSSLVARRLGATVHSFDYDAMSVACTSELKRRFFPDDEGWVIERGSVLDRAYLESLGTFDIVYSWGVLHHTGQMWNALENAVIPVAAGGRLFVAIYNDTGSQSRRWRAIKRFYNWLPRVMQPAFAVTVSLPQEAKSLARAVLTGRPSDYIRGWTACREQRGMSRWHDLLDWVGGYPYEYATPDEIFDFYRARGFELTKLKCGGVGLGCNEFVFDRGSGRGSQPVEPPRQRRGDADGEYDKG